MTGTPEPDQECACCGRTFAEPDLVQLAHRTDIAICRDCVDGLPSRRQGLVRAVPVLKTPDLAASMTFWTAAGFSVNQYGDDFASAHRDRRARPALGDARVQHRRPRRQRREDRAERLNHRIGHAVTGGPPFRAGFAGWAQTSAPARWPGVAARASRLGTKARESNNAEWSRTTGSPLPCSSYHVFTPSSSAYSLSHSFVVDPLTRLRPSERSGEITGGRGPDAPQPRDDVIERAVHSGVVRCHAVPADPVQISAALEEVVSGVSLAAMTRAPERLGDFLSLRFCWSGEYVLNSLDEPQRCCVLEPGFRASLDKSAGGIPVPKPARVGERASTSEHGSLRFDVCPGVQQGVENGDIVAARRPVQRCFRSRITNPPGVDVSARLHQQVHHGRAVREVTRPVGHCVQQRSGTVAVTDSGVSELGVVGEQAIERVEITGLRSDGGLHGEWIVGRDEHLGPAAPAVTTGAGIEVRLIHAAR